MKFEVGDKVKCIQTQVYGHNSKLKYYHLTLEKIYTITAIKNIHVTVKDDYEENIKTNFKERYRLAGEAGNYGSYEYNIFELYVDSEIRIDYLQIARDICGV